MIRKWDEYDEYDEYDRKNQDDSTRIPSSFQSNACRPHIIHYQLSIINYQLTFTHRFSRSESRPACMTF